MTDFCLRAADRDTMRAVMRATFEYLSGITLPEGEPTPAQGVSLTGTEWFADEVGEFFEPTGDVVETEFGPQPVMAARPGWHVNLRWNGGDERPPDHPAIEIVWSSDMRDDEGQPVPRPEWWTRVIA